MPAYIISCRVVTVLTLSRQDVLKVSVEVFCLLVCQGLLSRLVCGENLDWTGERVQDREIMLHNAKVHEDMSTIFGQHPNPTYHGGADVPPHLRRHLFNQVRNSCAEKNMLLFTGTRF